MAKAKDPTKRLEFFKCLDDGMLVAHAADKVGIGRRTGVVWAKRFRRDGEVSPRKEGRPRNSKLDAHYQYFVELLKLQPELSIKGIVGRLLADKRVKVHASTLWDYFEKVGLNINLRPDRLTRSKSRSKTAG